MTLNQVLGDRLSFFINRIRERLWVRPLFMCALSVLTVFVAKLADYTDLANLVPDITADTLQTLLSIIASSMLVIATFAVASMVSAYASASTTATPRAFALVIADDASQNALSAFIGAFIFSIVGLIALLNGIFGDAARFALFVVTLLVFVLVIMTFVRWVDRIARLGRVSNTIDKVEDAAAQALTRRRQLPCMGAREAGPDSFRGLPVYGDAIGYVQRIDLGALQALAQPRGFTIVINALPGTFASPGRVLAWVRSSAEALPETDTQEIAKQFRIGDGRTFDEDPRFGLVVLSEIASRALSPAVNDPGTAIDTIGSMVRLFALWADTEPVQPPPECNFDHILVPAISIDDMFDDAFTAIARDGAGLVEVMLRLQKALAALASVGDPGMCQAARAHSATALDRARQQMTLEHDLNRVQEQAHAVIQVARP